MLIYSDVPTGLATVIWTAFDRITRGETMSTQTIPIHRAASGGTSSDKKDIWFNAFDFAPGQDEHIRWLSRPNQRLITDKHAHDAEKFRITFDVENFKPDQIKVSPPPLPLVAFIVVVVVVV